MIDKNGRVFGKINILDLLFITGVIVIIVFSMFYLTNKKVSSDKVYFTVEYRNMTKEYADKIKIGDEIKDSIKDNYLGVVSNIEVAPEIFTVWGTDEEKFIKSPSDEEYNIRITVEANGSITDTDILAESYPVKVGKEVHIKGKGYANSGYIIAINYEGKN